MLGQYDIYDFLKRNPDEWFTSKDLESEFNVNIQSVVRAIKRLSTLSDIAINRTYPCKKAKVVCMAIKYSGGGRF